MAESKQTIYSRSMAEPRSNRKKKTKNIETEEAVFEEIREIELGKQQSSKQTYTKEIHNCDICMKGLILKFSVYLCYVCNLYMCEKCLKAHDKEHTVVKRKSENIERKEFGKNLVMNMRAERKRDKKLEGESMEVFGRVNVKHHLDEFDCEITGLCTLHDKQWALLDHSNSCMKIFSSVTNTLQRYICFKTELWDLTEIKQTFTAPDSASVSASHNSAASQSEKQENHLIVVTVGDLKQIWFIDTNATPAVKSKVIPMYKKCFSVDTFENKIFVLCREDVESGYRYSVAILTAEGTQLSTIQNNIYTLLVSDIVVHKGRVYLSDYFNDKILCINIEDGENPFQLVNEGFGPTGISVDSRNNVYACASGNNRIYKLSPDLTEKEPVNLNKDYTMGAEKLCFSNDKLFVVSSMHNIVNVIQLT